MVHTLLQACCMPHVAQCLHQHFRAKKPINTQQFFIFGVNHEPMCAFVLADTLRSHFLLKHGQLVAQVSELCRPGFKPCHLWQHRQAQAAAVHNLLYFNLQSSTSDRLRLGPGMLASSSHESTSGRTSRKVQKGKRKALPSGVCWYTYQTPVNMSRERS